MIGRVRVSAASEFRVGKETCVGVEVNHLSKGSFAGQPPRSSGRWWHDGSSTGHVLYKKPGALMPYLEGL